MLRVTLHIPPGEMRINRAYRKTRKGVRLSDQYRDARRAIVGDLRDEIERQGWRYEDFPVEVEIWSFWSGHDGDVDAPVKGVLDALQRARVIRDDKQVVRIAAEKVLLDDDPRLEICVTPRTK